MAEASISVDQDQFSCSICLDILKVPVAIPCGHSYCMSCITDCWNQDDQKGVYSCPQCRQTFTQRPALNKNTILAEMVEKLKIKLQTAVPAHCFTGAGDVECDVCSGVKQKATKSCLVCIISYCQNHLEQHDNLFKGKKHKLMDATGNLHEMICHQHDKLLELYCHNDQQCICYVCMMENHKSHDTVSAAAERTKKQKHLGETKKKCQQKIQEKEDNLKELRAAIEYHKRSAQAAVEECEEIFTDLIHSIERSRSEVMQVIRAREKAVVGQAEGLLVQLEQEISDLRKKDTELEQLSHNDDHIHFLQSFQSLSALLGSADIPSITSSSLLPFDNVRMCVSMIKVQLEHYCTQGICEISKLASDIQIIPTEEPKTRKEFLQYSRQFNLDTNTVNKRLHLSEGNRVITFTGKDQQYPDHPDRFTVYAQVLCRESVNGRCYWEVEWSHGVDISVSYKSISRNGYSNDCGFGYNNQSWTLTCSESSFSFWHNREELKLPVVPCSSRIGVYVDHSTGILSYYRISDIMTLIHRVQTTFTQPLYPGFVLYSKSKVTLLPM
ncbi:tripartite motif-containing protein 16-like isoform X1 [Xyrauchen texanus]|uniref:tripartite motif-containing protein 16-like isoform X1 n=1 Tax=Xyrauchen texanus TaxID=154827 RepID=UPI0022419082|nr:tripartite motif-containing protein 16-like isoform X1 [Xyrauchen texanus]